jgi:hypothetical protein
MLKHGRQIKKRKKVIWNHAKLFMWINYKFVFRYKYKIIISMNTYTFKTHDFQIMKVQKYKTLQIKTQSTETMNFEKMYQ